MENTPAPETSPDPARRLPAADTGVWQRMKRIPPLFAVVVLLPTLLAVLYFTLIASPVFVSESRFVVKNPSRSSGAGSTLAQMMGGSSYSSASADSYPVIDYLQSRDAAAELNQHDSLSKSYSERGDWLSKYHTGWRDNAESLWRYYKRRIIDVDIDDETSIIVMKTMAYTPAEAQSLNERLLQMGERLVNQMNDRAMHDAVDVAQQEVDRSEQMAKSAVVKLAQYRDTHDVYDPDQQSALKLQQAVQLQSQLYTAQSQLNQLKLVAPGNPQIPLLKTNIENLQQQINATNANVSGDKNSLSKSGPLYSEAAMDVQFTSQQLGIALASLETARTNAARKQLYLERIIQPNYPTEAIEPRRFLSVLTVLIAALLAWAILKLFISSVREHQD